MNFKNSFIKLVDILGTISFAVIIIVSLAQIVNRHFFGGSFSWAEELAVELMIWIAFLGAAKGTAQESHTNLAILVKKLPQKLQCIVKIISNLLCIIFAGICAYYGARLSYNSWSSITTGTKIPLGLIYLAVPFCSILMIIFLIYNSIHTIRQYGDHEKGVETEC